MDYGSKFIRSFTDLDVYQRSYKSALIASKELVPFLRNLKEYETADQISRSTKAIPALIAEGYAKRYQPKHLQKYIDDAIGEANESLVHVSITRDLGFPNKNVCNNLINEYIIIGKQLYNLGKNWQESKRNFGGFSP